MSYIDFGENRSHYSQVWRLGFVMRFPRSGLFVEGQSTLKEHLELLGLSEFASKVH